MSSAIGVPPSVIEIGRPDGAIRDSSGSIPSSVAIVANRSGTLTGFSTAFVPSAFVLP